MMQPRLRPAGSRARGRAPTEQRSLAVVHAAALYRPTPPVECDEEGYPFSDAKPMSEGDYHGDVLDYAKDALRARFAGHEVYASTDKFLFLEEGNRRAAVVPDVLVAFGPPSGPRQSYKHWEEGKARLRARGPVGGQLAQRHREEAGSLRRVGRAGVLDLRPARRPHRWR
ncbi:MAG: hypothetical protein OXU77_09275, partial [Gammaproteobacteria bacterium]|nr:hypothetical protein [Gammaproteobacteria bacterium]